MKLDQELKSTRTCSCERVYADHMLKVACEVSEHGAAKYCERLDRALADVPFPVRSKICGGFYMGIVRPAAVGGNSLWRDASFLKHIEAFTEEVERAANGERDKLQAMAENVEASGYA